MILDEGTELLLSDEELAQIDGHNLFGASLGCWVYPPPLEPKED